MLFSVSNIITELLIIFTLYVGNKFCKLYKFERKVMNELNIDTKECKIEYFCRQILCP